MGASFEDRLRFAEKTKIDAKAYWLKQSRYIQQVGDSGPEYVAAAPEAPVKILLEPVSVERTHKKGEHKGKAYTTDKHVDAFCVPMSDKHEPPAKPIPSHIPGKQPQKPKKSSEAAVAAPEGRAADK